MQLQIETLHVSLSTQLLGGGVGGAEHQLQVRLGAGGGLGARGWRLRLRGPVETHTAPLSVALQPVSLSRAEARLPGHAPSTAIPLHVTLRRKV